MPFVNMGSKRSKFGDVVGVCVCVCVRGMNSFHVPTAKNQ